MFPLTLSLELIFTGEAATKAKLDAVMERMMEQQMRDAESFFGSSDD